MTDTHPSSPFLRRCFKSFDMYQGHSGSTCSQAPNGVFNRRPLERNNCFKYLLHISLALSGSFPWYGQLSHRYKFIGLPTHASSKINFPSASTISDRKSALKNNQHLFKVPRISSDKFASRKARIITSSFSLGCIQWISCFSYMLCLHKNSQELFISALDDRKCTFSKGRRARSVGIPILIRNTSKLALIETARDGHASGMCDQVSQSIDFLHCV